MSDRTTGKAKEVAGKVTGDKELETEGKTQNLKGKAEDAIEDAKDAASGAAKAAKDALSGDDADDAQR